MNHFSDKDVHYQFNGFDENSKFPFLVKELIGQLHLEAPSDATTTASFTKYERLVSGAVQISSAEGVFSALGRSHNARGVLFQILRQLRIQLKEWKKKRFVQTEVRSEFRRAGFEAPNNQQVN